MIDIWWVPILLAFSAGTVIGIVVGAALIWTRRDYE